jgi:hypothetical protein
MDWIALLPILAFIALASGLIVVFRRTGRIVARTREVEGFRSSVHDLTTRIEASLSGATSRIDLVRHGELGPQALTDTLEVATVAVDRYLAEARALHGPRLAMEIRGEVVLGLERAGRALATVEHGTSIMASARGGARELEAQTSIKRGYLNLIHAREAISRQATRVDALAKPPDHTM